MPLINRKLRFGHYNPEVTLILIKTELMEKMRVKTKVDCVQVRIGQLITCFS